MNGYFNQKNKGCLSVTRLSNLEEISRPPFAGAVHRFGTTPIRIARVARWTQSRSAHG